MINAFDTPARQSFVVEMVEDKKDLANAIALNSSMVNSARLLGPAVAGVLIAAAGEGICFLIDGISYLAVIASLLAMTITARKAEKTAPDVLHGLREKVRPIYVRMGIIPEVAWGIQAAPQLPALPPK